MLDTTTADPLLGDAETELNDARVSGPDSPEWQALLDRDMTFLRPRGAYPGSAHKDWKNYTMPFRAWLEEGKGHGLAQHHERDCKGHSPVVFGAGGQAKGYAARSTNGMKTVEVVGIDCDAGDSYADTLDRVEALGLAVIAYTSFSDGKTQSTFLRDATLRKLNLERLPTSAEMRAHLPDKFRPHILEGLEVVGEEHDEDGMQIVCTHPPIEKFRLLFPLAEPQLIDSLAPNNQKRAREVYAAKVRGLAKKLGVIADPACFDVSRVFYMPSHPEGGDYALDVIRGRALTLEELPEVAKEADNPFSQAGAGAGGSTIPEGVTAGGGDVSALYRRYGKRWQLADMLEATDAARGSVFNDKLNVHCAFEDEHSSESADSSTSVWNADGGFARVKCLHSCQERHLHVVEYIARWIEDGVLDADMLEDPAFMSAPPDNPGPFEMLTPDEGGEAIDGEVIEEEAPKDRTTRHAEAQKDTRGDLLTQADALTADSTDAEVRELIRLALRRDADESTRERLKQTVATQTHVKARAFNRLWDAEAKEARQKQKRAQRGGAKVPSCDVYADFSARIEYAKDSINAANEEAPRLFRYADSFCVADAKNARIRLLETRDALHTELAKVTHWTKDSDGNVREVAPPEDVARFLFNDATFRDALPELCSVVSTPFFAADGSLVGAEGYDEAAGVYLAPGDLELARVSANPTDDEVKEAVRLLVEEVIADFPLGGMNRAQIMAATGEDAAPVAHTLAYMLLPFAREMIDGPTPGHVFTKPEAGTGASLMDDVCAMIDSAKPAAAIVPPSRPEELAKTLTGALKDGPTRLRFDNVGAAIDNKELASAMTAQTYGARVLGRSQLVDVRVRCVWGFTANNFEATKEVLRRQIFIPLDSHEDDPETRTPENGWRHANLRAWVRSNRGRLVWACLTIIQNWVAAGMEQQTDEVRGSYEEWSGVMGGILKAAGVEGFLLGQKAEQEKARDASQDVMRQFIDVLADYPSGTVFRPGSAAPFGDCKTVSLMDVLNGTERASNEGAGKKGDAKAEPILINGWGYDRVSGLYETSGQIGRKVKIMARKPWRSGNKVLTFTEETDTKNKTSVYRLEVKE